MNKFIAVPLLCVVFSALPVDEAGAGGAGLPQECGSWNEPVLCQSELQAYGEDRRWVRIDPARVWQLAPGTVIELEIRGLDQSGRTFPQNRLALAFDDRECSSTLDVEDRGEGRIRLSARSSMGRCRLEIWVPGNLNHAWRLEFEVTASARTGYSNAEAGLIVNALYRGLLGRDPDAAGLSAAIGEVQRGNLQSQVLSMVRSAEFQQSRGGLDANGMLDRLYQGIFGRPVDATGLRDYVARVQIGQYVEVVLSLLQSPEFEGRLESVR